MSDRQLAETHGPTPKNGRKFDLLALFSTLDSVPKGPVFDASNHIYAEQVMSWGCSSST
jgi:hypothetical protein